MQVCNSGPGSSALLLDKRKQRDHASLPRLACCAHHPQVNVLQHTVLYRHSMVLHYGLACTVVAFMTCCIYDDGLIHIVMQLAWQSGVYTYWLTHSVHVATNFHCC